MSGRPAAAAAWLPHLAESQRCADWLTDAGWRDYAAGVRAYSMDLRERIVAAVDEGMSQSRAAERFGVSLRTVERYLARRRATGDGRRAAWRRLSSGTAGSRGSAGRCRPGCRPGW